MMGGYRQDNFDLGGGDAEAPAPKGRRLKQMGAAIAYVVPCFWLWSLIDYQDLIGARWTRSSGRGETLEEWYYSYLLLERHHVLDLITFVYMWAPLAGFVGWIAFRALRRTKFSLYSRD
jgi:hypothetical protein